MVAQFEKLGICEHVLKVISAKKFEAPSEIQQKTIPLVMQGKDIIAGSKTGSGKTLAFGAGIIKNVEAGNGIQGLILTPTRELAEQVSAAMSEFAYSKKLEVVPVYGGVSIENQIKKLAYADIVVATPGRLLDHMNRNSIDLSHTNYLVLDEADRMWDMGFKEDVGKIVLACPKDKQTLLFSATISGDLADFASKYMKTPVEVSVESYVDASKLKQIYYDVRDNEKFSLLVHLLKNETAHLAMIFCNTRRNADFVANNLKHNGLNAQVIHGGMEQNKRSRVLKNFDDSKVNLLVCTDVAARGLDIQGVSHVYNYDIANDSRDYVHRIGRTARAGKEGIAINILASRDYDNFAKVQKGNPDLVITRENTPQFGRIFIKLDESHNTRGPRGRDNGRGGPNRGRDGGRDSRGPRRGGNFNRNSGNGRTNDRPRSGERSFGGPRRDSREGDSKGPRRSFGGPRRDSGARGNTQNRDQRGERNKRSNDKPRSGGKDGFRGSGRDTRRTRKE